MSPVSRLTSAVVLTAALAAPAAAQAPAPAAGKPIDLVLCLDVSSSMNGLVDSAKLRLWDVVNELARMKPTPDLRVGLYSYGHSTYPAATGWVRKEVDLTADLDEVYKALFALTIRGGTEYVARVTRAALTEQKWSPDPGALRLIFVCGNEPADQDKEVTLDQAAALAKKQGVVVNTIYCGPTSAAEARGWEAFAGLCGGRFLTIDQDRAVRQVTVKTEFDAEILRLDAQLSKTYLAYGREGFAKKANQAAQDANALKAAPAAPGAAPAAALGRAEFKAGGMYRNSGWDLLDRMRDDKAFDLSKVRDEDLPEEVRKLPAAERLPYLNKKAAERAAIQQQIAELSARRQKKIAEEAAKLPKSAGEQALDEALRGVVRDQARARGFQTPEK